MTANAKFNDFLREMEETRQKERLLYEDSIVRLLNNIEKKDKENRNRSLIDPMLSSRTSSKTRSSTGKSSLNKLEGLRGNVSFSHSYKII
jgi:hypothetical protein